MKLDRILIATDGSESAEVAVRLGVGLAKKFSANVRLVSVIEEPVGLAGALPVLPETHASMEEFASAALETASQVVSSAGLELDATKIKGKAAQMILREARDNNVDLIVLGHSSKSGFERALLGSAAQAIVNESTCAVLIAPPA